MTSYDWRAPKKAPDLRKILTIAAAALAALAVLVFGIRFITHEDPPPPPPPPTAQPLNDVEALGVKSALDDLTRPHQVSGTLTEGNLILTIKLTYTGDRSSGAGTVTAGRETAEALLDQNVVFLKGRPEFWQAVGIDPLPTPNESKWIALDPRYLNGKLFLSASDLSTAMSPTPSATLDGNIYKPSDTSAAQASLSSAGFTHYAVNGLDVDVKTVPTAEVESAFDKLRDQRGGQWGVMAGSPSKWALAPSPGATPPALDGTPGESADKTPDDATGGAVSETTSTGDTSSEASSEPSP